MDLCKDLHHVPTLYILLVDLCGRSGEQSLLQGKGVVSVGVWRSNIVVCMAIKIHSRVVGGPLPSLIVLLIVVEFKVQPV